MTCHSHTRRRRNDNEVELTFPPVKKADRKELHQTSKSDKKNEKAKGKHCVMMDRISNPSVTQLGLQLPNE